MWPHNPNAVRFEGMPIVDENFSNDGHESQVTNTPLSKEIEELPTMEVDLTSPCIEIPSMEGEVVHALKSMANIAKDTTLRYEAVAIGDFFLNLKEQELNNSIDPINKVIDSLSPQGGQHHSEDQERQHKGNRTATY
ncbi:hypothetical protein L7F22_031886 [Adiantum nelumboides]|nr:hypothetical protein [Adiantum nelumboides]